MSDDFNFSIRRMIKEEDLELQKIVESMEVTYDSINEAYNVNNGLFRGIIKVKGLEREIPHFHVEFDGHEACFCIFEAKYYNHERHHVKMTAEKLRGLNIFLMSPDPTYAGNGKRNYWQQIVDDWVAANSSVPFEHKDDWASQTKPNYELTTENRYTGPNNNFKNARAY